MTDHVEGFKVEELPKSGVVSRLRGRITREAAFISIRNLLATTRWDQVYQHAITDILAKAKITSREAVAELSAILEHAALIAVIDRVLTDEEKQGLLALQRAFDLTDTEASCARQKAAGKICERMVREAIAGGAITVAAKEQLQAAVLALGMTDDESLAIYKAAANEALQLAFDAVIADRRVTGSEEQQLRELAASLGITNVNFTAPAQKAFQRFRLLSQIDAGDLPIVAPPIILGRDETCHFWEPAVIRKELRTVTKRVNYSGPTVSIPIVRGVRWRLGSMAVQRVSEDILTDVDKGAFVISSKKVSFQGARSNASVNLTKIMNFVVFADGLQIKKQSGRDMYIVGRDRDWELAGACLDGAIQKAL